jgi:hypothetical protein
VHPSGYNAQAAVSTDQVIVAAEVTNAANDSTMFVPMVRASEENLAAVDADGIGTFVADTGYWSVENVTIATPFQGARHSHAGDQGDRRP